MRQELVGFLAGCQAELAASSPGKDGAVFRSLLEKALSSSAVGIQAREALSFAVVVPVAQLFSFPQVKEVFDALLHELILDAASGGGNGEAVARQLKVLRERLAFSGNASSVPQARAEALLLSPDADKELVAAFLSEGRELSEKAEAGLLSLESGRDPEAINEVFRAFHTLKGMSSFLGLEDMARLAHESENILAAVRAGELKFDTNAAGLLLRALDLISRYIEGVATVIGGGSFSHPAERAAVLSELAALNPGGGGMPRVLASLPVELPAVSPAAEDCAPHHDAERAESFVRVRTDRLDQLIDGLGDMLSAVSAFSRDQSTQSDGAESAKKLTHLHKSARELHALGMTMRMVPLKPLLTKARRLARDLAERSGKNFAFDGQGDCVEADRNMLSALEEIMVHMLRNAVDHGVEAPEERAKAGKPAQASVAMRLAQEGNSLVFELRDDGRGLDREKIASKALERGLIQNAQALSEQEIFAQIFAPGFSTAEKVTDISGRGVGMDVVKKLVDDCGGKIGIQSTPGEGCCFRLVLPLTLAISDVMLISCGGQKFIMPMRSIKTTFSLERQPALPPARKMEMVWHGERLIPIFKLHQVLGLKPAEIRPGRRLAVVVEDNRGGCALEVDELLGQQLVVSKPFEGFAVEGVSAGAILGDGGVGLVLDPAQISSIARTELDAA